MTQPSLTPTTSRGEFESSFAGGLDLSEFLNTNKKTNTMPQKSAAKELLRVKSLEKRQREKDEAEEQRLGIAVQNRVSNFEESLLLAEQRKRKSTGSIVVDALVKMHGHDTAESPFKLLKKSSSSGGGGGKKKRTRTSTTFHQSSRTSSKSAVTKKSRRIKYSR